MASARDLSGYPPESTRLRIGDDIAWSDVGGVYDRDDSLKENTNPKCLLKNHPGGGHSGNNGSSQRFSGNLKPTAAPIIGISGKLGQGGKNRHHPKKAVVGGGGRNPKAAVPEREPTSPKVSCIGKVLSDRERARRGRPVRSPGMRRPSGCCPGLGSLFHRSHSRKNAVECVDHSPPPPSPWASRRRETRVMEETEEATPAPAPVPGLGGMMRFASGRRAADWAAQMESDGRVARSGPL
ncbi:hypothetical protein E2562_024352 [Oryza meyeriana var. granulata]|uniref:Uncharacterized protein n=1 Tax=Oryza meyeriana var. granulata TaxID=110450 RepID=A0A6G1CA54_9ORYZ|nr:hypothetical protein E2562_024352 [Oryza meyeriana var. granulata]